MEMLIPPVYSFFSEFQSHLIMKKTYSESERDRVSEFVFNIPAD